jgi:hypothetical protein
VLYWTAPDAAFFEKRPWYKPEDFTEPELEVFDENWEPLQVFVDNMTQWRVGAAGPIGLDYNVIHSALSRKNLSNEDFDAMMRDIAIIERAALREMRSNS